MGFIDKVDNKWKHMNSKRSENSEIDEIRKKIEAENEIIKEQIVLIGQHFWNLYTNGQYEPTGDRELFEKIDDCNSNIRLLTVQADNVRLKGLQERERIDEETMKISLSINELFLYNHEKESKKVGQNRTPKSTPPSNRKALQ